MLRSDYTPLTRKKDEMIKCENDAHPECPLAQACRHAGCREGSQAQVRPRAFSWRAGSRVWLCRCLLALPGCGCKARVCVLSPAVPVQRDFRIGRDIGGKSRPVGGHSGQQTSLVTLGVEGATTILVGVGGCLAREAAASGLGVGFSIKADK